MATPCVVVADPSGAARTRVRKLLESMDDLKPMRVLEAKNRSELDGQIKAHGPALVISEVLLAGGSGYDLLRSLAGKSCAPRVILVSEMAREIDRYWALRQGAHAYVSKPYKNDDLEQRVRQALTGAPPATPERS